MILRILMVRQFFVAIVLSCLLAVVPMAASAAPAPGDASDDNETTLMPPWMAPDVIQAASDIGMTDEQLPHFRRYLTEFVEAQLSAYVRLSRSNSVRDAVRKIRGKTKSLLANMDGQMGELLDAEQFARYEIYRDLLVSKMRT